MENDVTHNSKMISDIFAFSVERGKATQHNVTWRGREKSNVHVNPSPSSHQNLTLQFTPTYELPTISLSNHFFKELFS